MTERRPFPPSPRRLALARQAGLSSASPVVVGAAACIGALLATVFLARAAKRLVGGWIGAACGAADDASLATNAAAGASQLAIDGLPAAAASQLASTGSHGLLDIDDLLSRVIELAAPILAAAAIVALVTHFAQTRSLWLPRRRVPSAPVVEPARVQRGVFEISAAIIVGLVAFGWLWTTAPRLANLFVVAPALPAVGSAFASLVVALAIAWVALGVLDALLRHVELSRALAMTVAEKREDDRLAAADPRWRAQRAALGREPAPSHAVARAALVLLGDDIAVAIAWNPRYQPVPVRTITGRRARATQLLGLARRHRIAVHRDAQLASALVDSDGPVPEALWARLAEIVAAAQAAHTGRDVSR
jgi:flagellar biosynthesis protein FlhB